MPQARETHAAVQAHDDCAGGLESERERREGQARRTAPEVLVAVLDVEVDLVCDARALRLDALRAEEHGERDEQEAQREAAEYHLFLPGSSE